MEDTNEIFTEETLEKAIIANCEEAASIIEEEDKFERFVQRLENKLKLVPGIGPYLSDIACMVSLVRSYIKKEYTDIPLGTIISIVSTLIYIVSPVDLIPDPLPVIGYVDDIILLGWILKSIRSDVAEYKKWRKDNGKQIVNELDAATL